MKQMFGLNFIRTDVFPPYYSRDYSSLFEFRQTGDCEELFNHDKQSVAKPYPKAKENVSAVKKREEDWMAENAGE